MPDYAFSHTLPDIAGSVDVLGCMNDMRRQRSTVVQTEDQYVFIYYVLADVCKPFGTLCPLLLVLFSPSKAR